MDRGHSFGIALDQTGQWRRFDDLALTNAPGGDSADIGAVEVQTGSSFTAMALVGNTTRIACQGLPQRPYQFLSSDDLTSGFTNLGAPQTTDTIGRTEFTDPSPLPARRFYKIVPAP